MFNLILKIAWYRDCDWIRDISKLDIFMLADEYEDTIEKYFLGNENAYIYLIHGFVCIEIFDFK